MMSSKRVCVWQCCLETHTHTCPATISKSQINCEENVKLNVEAIRQRSPLLRKMEEEGKVKIVGAMYEMATGQVHFMK